MTRAGEDRLRSSEEQVKEDNRKCQYWKKGWRGERERERERHTHTHTHTHTHRKLCLFSSTERYNQVHISVVNHKGPLLVCGSQRGAKEQAEASLFRPLPSERRKKISEVKTKHWSTFTSSASPPSCITIDLHLYFSFFLTPAVNHSPRFVSTGQSCSLFPFCLSVIWMQSE